VVPNGWRHGGQTASRRQLTAGPPARGSVASTLAV
jgi:hypothetical protein